MGDLDLSDRAHEMLAMFVRWSTYAADHHTISADVAATQLHIASRGITYIDGGWKTLVVSLIEIAQRFGTIVDHGVVSHVEPLAAGGAEVHIDDRRIPAPAVVLAAGSPSANSTLMPTPPAPWSTLGPQISAACLDLGVDHIPATSVLLGVDQPLYLIRHAPPAQLAPPGHAVVHVMKYLTPDDTATSRETRRHLEDHAAAVGIEPDRATVGRYLHQMPVVTASATPEHGGLRGRPSVTSSGHPGVFVAGDWVGPTGHLADASFASGHHAGREAGTTSTMGSPLTSTVRGGPTWRPSRVEGQGSMKTESKPHTSVSQPGMNSASAVSSAPPTCPSTTHHDEIASVPAGESSLGGSM